jgi:hypothetical protein
MIRPSHVPAPACTPRPVRMSPPHGGVLQHPCHTSLLASTSKSQTKGEVIEMHRDKEGHHSAALLRLMRRRICRTGKPILRDPGEGHKVYQSRARVDVRPAGRKATERTPCQPQRVRRSDKVYWHGRPARLLCAVVVAPWGVWHSLCTDHQADRARKGISTRGRRAYANL